MVDLDNISKTIEDDRGNTIAYFSGNNKYDISMVGDKSPNRYFIGIDNYSNKQIKKLCKGFLEIALDLGSKRIDIIKPEISQVEGKMELYSQVPLNKEALQSLKKILDSL